MDRKPSCSAACFTGDAAQLLAAALWPVGLREHRRHLDARLRRAPAAMGTANSGVPRKTTRIACARLIPLAGFLQLLDLAPDDVALQRTQMIDEKNAVQVIDLVLKSPRQQFLACRVRSTSPFAFCARTFTLLARVTCSRKPGNAQAAFFTGLLAFLRR